MQIGRYVVEREIGRGSMGIVYLATDPAIHRQVAIKTVNVAALQDPQQETLLRERLRREARSAALLSHPGIVTVYDALEHEGSTCLVMEYVDGETLSRKLTAGIPPQATAVSLVRQMAAALDYAHHNGVIHRDVKPANIIVTGEGVAKIADFGLARVIGRNTTYAASFLGTPGYMAPEQIRDEPVSGAADQFALGAIAYELLTGRRPFDADAITSLIFKILQDPMPITGFGDAMDYVLGRAMAKGAADRYYDCSHFAESFAEALAVRMVVPAATVAVPVATPQQARGSSWKAAVGGVAGVAVVIAGAFTLLRQPAATKITTTTVSPAEVSVPAPPAVAQPVTQPPPRIPDPPAATVAVRQQPVPAKKAAPEPAPEPEPPKPAPIVKAQPAPLPRVLITTKPQGAVLVFDGVARNTCVSPCERDFPSGTHTVKATLAEHRDATASFDVPGPPQVTLTLDRLQGVIAFDANLRGATIVVDGQESAVRPPAELLLPAGDHAIKLLAPNGTVVFDRSLTVQHQGRILVRAPEAPAAPPPPAPTERKVPSLKKRRSQ